MGAQLRICLDDDALTAIADAVAERVLAKLGEDHGCSGNGDRLAWSEQEAASMLGLQRHQLRDARLRGEIGCSRGPRGRIMYRREDLDAYLASSRNGRK